MTDIQPELTPAMEAYLTALIYRNTRTSCCSLAALCARVTHDRLQRLLYERFAWSRRLWDFFAARLVRAGGYVGEPNNPINGANFIRDDTHGLNGKLVNPVF